MESFGREHKFKNGIDISRMFEGYLFWDIIINQGIGQRMLGSHSYTNKESYIESKVGTL